MDGAAGHGRDGYYEWVGFVAAGVVGYSYLFYRLPSYMWPESSFLQQRSNTAGGPRGPCDDHVILRIDRIYMLGRRMDNVGSCVIDVGVVGRQVANIRVSMTSFVVNGEESLWRDSDFHLHRRVWDEELPFYLCFSL
ncbi:hypothetical protein B0T18DRAFT_349192, partial [Schizothecium vesticola]